MKETIFKKNYLPVLIVLLILMTFFSVTASAESPSDITGHWAKEEILNWQSKGLMTGYADGSFKPDNPVTRAEFMTLVNRAFGFKAKAQISFSDVLNEAWYHDEIAKAVAAGYIKGYEDGSIKPDNRISRQEAAVVLVRLLKLKAVTKGSEISKFKDVERIHVWAKSAINTVVSGKYMSGYPDETYRPANPITRAETVKVLSKSIGELYNLPGVYGSDEVNIIEGNVTINTSGVTLQNVLVKGLLNLTAGIGDGTVTLEGVRVQGKVLISGGGADSIILEDCVFDDEVMVDRKDGRVRVAAQGNTKIRIIRVEAGSTKLEENSLTEDADGFINVYMESGEEIDLDGDFEEVTITTPGTKLNLISGRINTLNADKTAANTEITLGADATVNKINIDATISVSGNGSIETAVVKAENVIIEQTLKKVVLGEGVSAVSVAGKIVTQSTENTPVKKTTTNGGGGSGRTTPTVTLSSINNLTLVTGEIKTITIDTNARTLSAICVQNGTTVTANIYENKLTVEAGNEPGTAQISVTAERDGYKNRTRTFYVTVSDIGGSNTYILTLEAYPQAGGSVANNTNAEPYTAGAIVNVTAIANDGYRFASWTVDGQIVCTGAAFGYTMPSADTALTANFIPEGYIPIATADELNNIRYDGVNTFGYGTPYEGEYTGGMDKKYLQVTDIDLDTSPYNEGQGWQPIGTAWSNPFIGVFNGNNLKILNLFIDRPDSEGVGLFGYAGEGSTLISMSLENVDVTGKDYAGGLVGISEKGTIKECHTTGDVKGYLDVGGLVGSNYNFDSDVYATIIDSGSTANATAAYSAGGLAGSNYGLIEDSWAAGTVIIVGKDDEYAAGGLVGTNHGFITDSFASGDVNGNCGGGLVGENYKNPVASNLNATITNSHATGSVSKAWCIGGLAGYNSGGTIGNCYASGDISGEESVAGLVGDNSGVIENSFALNNMITRSAGSYSSFGRITGYNRGTLENNHAWVDMNFVNIDYTPVSDTNGVDGMSIFDWIIEDGEVTNFTLVVPEMSGTVTIEGELKYGEELTADTSTITYDPLTIADVPAYQWYRSGAVISGATAATYILEEADIGQSMLVTVTADGTNATGSVTSELTAMVEKADGPAAPASPKEADKTHDTIILTANEEHQFSIDGGSTWQDSNEFTGLSPNTEYTLRARIKETATHKASQPSEPLNVQTLQIVSQLAEGDIVEFDDRDYFVLNPATGYLLGVQSINSPTGDLINWGPNNDNPSYIKTFLDNWFESNIQNKDVVQSFGGSFDKIGLISSADWNNRPAEVTNPDYVRIGRTWTSTKAGSTTHVWQIKSEDGSLIQGHASSSYGDVRHAIKILSNLAVETVDDKMVVMVP